MLPSELSVSDALRLLEGFRDGETGESDDESTAFIGSFTPDSLDADARTIDLTFTTGAPVKRYDWRSDSFYDEVLEVSEDAIELDRFKAGAPLLNSHDGGDLRSVLGVLSEPRIEDGVGIVKARFSARADVEPIFQDVANGILRNVSVGYRVKETAEERDEDGRLIKRTATRWEPMETSLVAVPADPGAQVRSENTMQETQNRATPEASPNTAPREPEQRAESAAPDLELIKQHTAEATRAEIREIRKACRVAKLSDEATDEILDRGLSLDKARAAIFERMATEGTNDQEVDGRHTPGDGKREKDFAQVLSQAIELRESPGLQDRPDYKVHDDARYWLHRSASDMFAAALEIDGKRIEDKSPANIWDQIATRADITTTTLGSIVALTASRQLQRGYDAEPRVFAEIFEETSAANFRTIHRPRLSDIGPLPLVAEGANYTEGTLSDSLETYALASYGQIISITRQMLIDDDLSALSGLPFMLGAAGAARENEVFWAVVNGNANMSDGNAIFSAAHGDNIDTQALSAPALESARAAMNAQTTPAGNAANLQPAWLVVGTANQSVAEKLVSSPPAYADPNSANMLSQAHANQLALRVEPLVAGNTWYNFASTVRAQTFQYAYLRGRRGVNIENQVKFESGAVQTKATLDFGAGVLDYRGAFFGNAP